MSCRPRPVANLLQTYHAMCFDHLLPIFFEDDRAMVDSISTIIPSNWLYFPGGLGLSMPAVGMISKYIKALACGLSSLDKSSKLTGVPSGC